MSGSVKLEQLRNSLRHPMALDVTLRSGGSGVTAHGRSVDISRSGIFVVLSDRIPEGRRVDLEITSRAVDVPAVTSGIVVHTVVGVGVGIRFSRQNLRTRERIGKMIEALKSA